MSRVILAADLDVILLALVGRIAECDRNASFGQEDFWAARARDAREVFARLIVAGAETISREGGEF